MSNQSREEGSIEHQFGEVVGLAWSAASYDSWPGFEYLSLCSGTSLPERKRPAGPLEAASEAANVSERAIAAISAAESKVRAAGIISVNDTLDDITTKSLRYIMLPFLGAIAHAAWQGQPSERLAHLEAAKAELSIFFRNLDRIGLLSHVDRDRIVDDTLNTVQTPQQKRDALIARHKLEKNALEKIKTVLARRYALGESVTEEIEDLEREAMVTILESGFRRGVDSLASIKREIEILEYAVASQAKGIDPSVRAAEEKRSGVPRELNGLPTTFRIVNERERLREGVFRPSHALPTYTVEEWGQIERQHALQADRVRREAVQLKANVRAEEDSDGDDASNNETYRSRKWDDWKDDHNRGSGNTLR